MSPERCIVTTHGLLCPITPGGGTLQRPKQADGRRPLFWKRQRAPGARAADWRWGGEGEDLWSLSDRKDPACPLTPSLEAVTDVLLDGLWASQMQAVGPQGPSGVRKLGPSGKVQAGQAAPWARRRSGAGFLPLGVSGESLCGSARAGRGLAGVSGASDWSLLHTPSWLFLQVLPQIPETYGQLALTQLG